MSSSDKTPMPGKNAALVIEHIDYARRAARQFYYDRRKMGVELEDFEGAALLGLCDAARRFDESRGMPFHTFCFFRVRGAMYDLLRRANGISRNHYASLTRTGEPENEAAVSSNRSHAKLPYVFARNGLELGTLASIIEEVGIRLHLDDDREVIGCSYASDRDPERAAMLSNTRRYLKKLMRLLPERERRVLELRYFAGQTFDEIRASLKGATKSWISRLHARALDNLRAIIVEEATKVEGELSASQISGDSFCDYAA